MNNIENLQIGQIVGDMGCDCAGRIVKIENNIVFIKIKTVENLHEIPIEDVTTNLDDIKSYGGQYE